MELLNDMNAEGRERLSQLRKYLERYETIVRETTDSIERQELQKDVESHRQQYTRYVYHTKFEACQNYNTTWTLLVNCSLICSTNFLYCSSLAAFRQANINAMLRIENAAKAELMSHIDKDNSAEVGAR